MVGVAGAGVGTGEDVAAGVTGVVGVTAAGAVDSVVDEGDEAGVRVNAGRVLVGVEADGVAFVGVDGLDVEVQDTSMTVINIRATPSDNLLK